MGGGVSFDLASGCTYIQKRALMKHMKYFLIIATFTVSLFALTAQGDSIVRVDDTLYDISILTGSFSANQTTIESTPWWGNESLAQDFHGSSGGRYVDGKYVAYAWGTTDSGATVLVQGGPAPSFFLNTPIPKDAVVDYIIGNLFEPVIPGAVPEPSIVWLFGIGAVIYGGYAWRKQQRIR